MNEKNEKLVEQYYQANATSFKNAEIAAKKIISSALENELIGFLTIQSRIKDIDSAKSKFHNPAKNYKDPQELTDWVALRVIVYLEKDIAEVARIIRNNFHEDVKNFSDKTVPKDTDRFGYSSLHLVLGFGATRVALNEYRDLARVKFEVQIRTALQHAWAEIEHKRNYKSSHSLPKELARRLSAAAAALELVDLEFSRISQDAETYIKNLAEKENEPISSIAIATMLNDNHNNDPKNYPFEFTDKRMEETALRELSLFGVDTIGELKELLEIFNRKNITPNTPKRARNLGEQSLGSRKFSSPIGALRLAMMCSNAQKYFEKSYDASFNAMQIDTYKKLSKIHGSQSVDKLLSDYEIDLADHS